MPQLKSIIISIFMIASIPSNAHAFLITENNFVYDSNLNAVWSSDANLFATLQSADPSGPNDFINKVIAANNGVVNDTPNSFDTPSDSGTYDLTSSDFSWYTGQVDWWGAVAFVNYLNSISYAGLSNWSLPSTPDQDSSAGYNQTTSQLGELFYNELGGAQDTPITTNLFTNWNETNNTNGVYWSNEYSASANYAWYFDTYQGYQDFYANKIFSYNVMVISDNASWFMLPLPSSFGLFAGAIGGIYAGFLRKKTTQR